MLSLKKKEKARRTTVAPRGIIEGDNYYMLGSMYHRVITFLTYPENFGEGLLAGFVNNPNYHFDMVTSPSTIDIASAIKKEMNAIKQKLEYSTDNVEVEQLRKKYFSIDNFVKQTVQNNSATLNVVVNVYIRASSLQELNELSSEFKKNLSGTGFFVETVSQLQIELMKKNSPLFIENELPTDTDYLVGQPLSSISTAGLWPWIFDTLDDEDGILLGKEMTNGGKVLFDQFYWLNNKSKAKAQGRTAGNMIIVGKTGYGKTVLMNLLIMGHFIKGRKIIWLDPENKNQFLTKFLGGNYIAFGRDNQIINIFDLKPVSEDDEVDDNGNIIEKTTVDMYDTSIAISNVVEDITITFKMLKPQISDEALDMVNEITVLTYRSVGIESTTPFKHLEPSDYPIFTNFSAIIEQQLEKYSEKIHLYQQEYDALKELKGLMRRIVGSADIPGQWSRYLNGHTSIDTKKALESGMLSIGTKYLASVEQGLSNALMRMTFNYAWSACLGSEEEAVLASDEDHTFILVNALAAIKAQIQRRARKYNTVTISGTQQVKDYSHDSIIQHGQAIFDNATYRFYFYLEKKGIEDLSELVTLTDGEIRQLDNLPPHSGIFTVGNKKMPMEVLATPSELELIK